MLKITNFIGKKIMKAFSGRIMKENMTIGII